MALSGFLGALIGAILGLTGAGGGILAVPALSMGMHWSMQQAAPVALIAVAFSAAIGVLEGLRHGLVRYKAATLIAVSGFPWVYLGQMLAHGISQSALQAGFALVMLLVALRLFWQGRNEAESEADISKSRVLVHPESGKFIWTLPAAAMLAFIGGVTGLMTGVLGVGGGFVIVPMLRKFTNVSAQGIVGTSLMVIALVGASGVASAVIQHTAVPWVPATVFTAMTVAGMLVGRMLIRRIAAHHVQTVFALVLTVVALGLMVRASFAMFE